MAIAPIRPKPNNWTLWTAEFINGQVVPQSAKPLADYGFSNGRLHRENLGADTLTFTKDLTKFDTAPDISYGQLVLLRDRQGVTRFVGTRVIVPGTANGSEEYQQYQFVGPWYWLERVVYRQTWQQLLVNGQLVPRTTSHLLLNGTDYRTVGQQITHVANFAISQGAPFQMGTIDIPIVPFITEITDQNCAQVIADQLRFAPDAVAWFDYSNITPKLHVRRAANLEQVSLTLGPGQLNTISDDGLTITSRPDNQVSSVSLRYERTDTLDGKEYLQLGEDIYPPGSTGSGLNAVHSTITLAGYNRTTVKASILCETINTASLDWWKRVIPRLQDQRIKSLSVTNVQRVLQGSRTDANPSGTTSSQFPRMLVEGQLADWMADATDQALDWEQEEISAEFTFDLDVDPTSGVKLEKLTKLRIPVQLVSTTAPAGESNYSAVDSEEEGEQAPAGLAQYLYESMSRLEYEGSVMITQNELTAFIGPGNRLNILGTQEAGHATMKARVQVVDEYIDQGQTVVNFGATPVLSLGTILEFMRATRHRRRWTRSEVQVNGESPNEITVSLGKATANVNTITGDQQHKFFAVQDTAKRIELDGNQKRIRISETGVTPTAELQTLATESRLALAGSATTSGTLTSSATNSKLSLSGAGGVINADSALCNGKTLQPREETWCDPSTGARRKIMVLASAPYD